MKVNGMQVPLNTKVGHLPVGVQQKVEIIKILFRGADILILDEPTAVLTPQETEELFSNIKRLTNQGKTVIFITHKLNEVMQVSNHVAVMRRGRLVTTMKTTETDQKRLAEAMVGRALPKMQERDKKDGAPVVELKDISLVNGNGLYALKDINLVMHQGEIIGVAGISGNGQQEMADIISGIASPTKGNVFMHTKEITKHTRKQRIEDGISYIPADRKKEGLCMEWSLAQNAFAGYHTMKAFIKKLAGFPLINTKNVQSLAEKLITQFDIRTEGTETIVDNLSGGNQQKIVIARESIVNEPQLLIAAEPTRGVDIGAISFIHNHMIQMRNNDTGILLISSDLDEIFALSDTIIVLYEGKIVCKVPAGEMSKEELGLYMAGSKVQEVLGYA